MTLLALRERAAKEGVPLGIVAAECLHVIVLDAYGVAASRPRIEERLAAVAAADLGAEMERFLPQRQRTQLGGQGYSAVRDRALAVLEGAARILGSG